MHSDDLTAGSGALQRDGQAEDAGFPQSPLNDLALALVIGVILGPFDLFAQRIWTYPWADLLNSSAVWALAAYGVGAWTRRGPLRSAAAGVVLLLAAVESYYVFAVLALPDELPTLLSSRALSWLALGLLIGAVFGAAGHLRMTGTPLAAATATALPVATLLAEAFARAVRGYDRSYHDIPTALSQIVLALILAAVTVRTTYRSLQTLVIAFPCAALGWAAFRVTGIVS